MRRILHGLRPRSACFLNRVSSASFLGASHGVFLSPRGFGVYGHSFGRVHTLDIQSILSLLFSILSPALLHYSLSHSERDGGLWWTCLSKLGVHFGTQNLAGNWFRCFIAMKRFGNANPDVTLLKSRYRLDQWT